MTSRIVIIFALGVLQGFAIIQKDWCFKKTVITTFPASSCITLHLLNITHNMLE